jgi:hypothetical protein
MHVFRVSQMEFDIAIMAYFTIGFQWLYFFASNAWIAVSHFSVTSKVSDGWGSAFMMPMYKSALDISFSCVHEWISYAMRSFYFLYSTCHIALRSFTWLAGRSVGRGCLAGFAIMALEHTVVFQKPKSLDSLYAT